MSRERQFDIEDNRSQLHVTGSRQALKLPAGLPMWGPKKPGSYRLEFIPFQVTDKHNLYIPDLRYSRPGKWYPERTYFAHFGIGVDNASYTCALKTFGKSCPICEARARLTKSAHPEDEERAASLRPRERQLYLIMERNDRGELDREIKLWEVSYHNWGQNLQKYIEGADAEDRDAFKRYYHPINGFTVKVTASEETMGKGANKFLEFTVHEFKARREPIDEEVFDHGFDLDDMIRVVEYNTLRDIFHGTDSSDDDAPRTNGRPTENGRGAQRDSGPPPRTSEPAPAPRGRGRAADPEPEPEPAPAPRGRAVAPPADPEPAPTDGFAFATGDLVEFDYRGKIVEGTIRKVQGTIAHVAVDGFDRDAVVDFVDLTLLRADDTFDAKPAPAPAPAPRGRAAAPPAEPEPAPAPRGRGRAAAPAPAPEPEPEPAPAPRGRGRAAAPPADPEPAPAPAPRGRAAAPAKPAANDRWNDDDDGTAAFQRTKR